MPPWKVLCILEIRQFFPDPSAHSVNSRKLSFIRKQNEAKMSKRSMHDWWLLDCEVLKTNRKVKPGPTRNKPEGFENRGLSQRFGLPFTLIRYEKGAFRKRSANQRNLKMLAIRFCVGENILKTELFGKHDVTMITWSPCRSFSQTQIQNGRWLLVFKFLRRQ